VGDTRRMHPAHHALQSVSLRRPTILHYAFCVWGVPNIPHRSNCSLASYKAVSYMCAMKVVATLGYDRRARKLLTPTERAAAELEIALAPTAWPVIRGTGGARKARAARGGRGKSGGVRIIYFVVSRRGVIYMIDIYAKSEKEDLTDAERREIHKLVVALEAEG